MDFNNKAIYELPVDKWDKESCKFSDDNYYNQYYFKFHNYTNVENSNYSSSSIPDNNKINKNKTCDADYYL